jgi:hypothetical protein
LQLPSRAAAPPAGRQAPAFYRTKVGDFDKVPDSLACGSASGMTGADPEGLTPHLALI